MTQMSKLSAETEASTTSVSEISRITQETPTLTPKSKPGPYITASLRNVLSIRKDIAPEESVIASRCSSYKPDVVTCTYDSPALYAEKACTSASVMCTIENDMITRICKESLKKTPPYSAENKLRSGNTPTTSRCCARITMNGHKNVGNINLPMSAPSVEQIEKCQESASYNKNVYRNIGNALRAQNIKVTICPTLDSGSESSVAGVSAGTQVGKNKSTHMDTVYMDSSIPVRSLVTTEVLQDLLFGESRITSSAGLFVGPDASETYASGVHVFQEYGNICVGENVTLTPLFLKKTPFVVSMNCPELGISDVVTRFSGTRPHERFGPNHTTRIAEVVSAMVPFVNQCCEAKMGLNSNIVEDLEEDHDMPTATCVSIKHCFAHNSRCGLSACLFDITFVLPTSILNTHSTSNRKNMESTSFPVETEFRIHVAALSSTSVVST